MAKIVVSLATGVSVMLLIGMLLLTFAGKMAGTSGLPLSLTDDLHLSTWSQWWDVRLVVFNDLKHGPGQEEKVWTIKPPADPDTLEMNEQQLGDTLGVPSSDVRRMIEDQEDPGTCHHLDAVVRQHEDLRLIAIHEGRGNLPLKRTIRSI